MADEIRRIFTATLIMGSPGTGKTSLFPSFATYLWETYRKILLLYSWDGGAIPTMVQKLMKQGLIRFWRARTRSAEGLGLETLYLASKGYWPRLIDPVTGETSPAVDLVAPVTASYTTRCPQDHVLAVLPARQLVTPTYCEICKTMITPAEQRVTETVNRTKGFDLVGGVGFDGLTSMSDGVMDYMDHERGAGRIGGEKPAFGGSVISGGVKLGGNNRADVGFAQSRAKQFVNNSLSIPYLVEGPVFTALSFEATDEGGLPIVGPKLPGRAATDEASAWFGNVYEMGKSLDEAGQEHFTLYLRPYTDAQNRRHLLKTSASPTGLRDKLVDPIGQPWAQANLGLVFRMLDEDLKHALAEEIPGAPGLAATPASYGEPPTATPAAPPQAAVEASAIPPLTPTPTVAEMPMATARRRRPEPAAAPTPAPTPVTSAPSESLPLATVASGGPPAPPGMKPPQRMPGSEAVKP